jgi:ADP-heptose:LPS heptosyltransferase
VTKVAIVKPDHLGDLILAIPAIRAIQSQFEEVSLFVNETSKGLASHLFADMNVRTVVFPHLARNLNSQPDLASFVSSMELFDFVFWLRDDPFIRNVADQIKAQQDFGGGDHLTHESRLHKRMLLRHLPNYSRTQMFGSAIRWPATIKNIGLCVSAGFPTNRWPNCYWVELASGLIRSGWRATLIGGPNERGDLTLLSRCLNSLPHKILVGGADIAAFLEQLAYIDIIVATDSGTAHICSLRKPVLSIFGSSPWRRYAPFGRDNIVITQALNCSPCVQFSSEEVNGCLTRECAIGLTPSLILNLLKQPLPRSPQSGIVVQRGTSHLQ